MMMVLFYIFWLLFNVYCCRNATVGHVWMERLGMSVTSAGKQLKANDAVNFVTTGAQTHSLQVDSLTGALFSVATTAAAASLDRVRCSLPPSPVYALYSVHCVRATTV